MLSYNSKTVASKVVVYIIVLFALIITSIPLYWLVTTAFKPGWAIVHRPTLLIPPSLSFESFSRHSAFGSAQFTDIPSALKDSLIVAFGNTSLSVVLGIFAAYSITRFKTGGKNLSFWILSNRFLPPIVPAIPLFLILRKLQLFDTHFGLILVYCSFNIPFATWLLMGFIQEIPTSIEEAALVDGCTRVSAIFRVLLPLIAPGIAVSALFCFLFAWNEYTMAFVLTGETVNTIPIVILTLRGTHDILYGEVSAATIISIIPAIVLAFLLQRRLARGLTMGAIK